jgi:hypothetical protein
MSTLTGDGKPIDIIDLVNGANSFYNPQIYYFDDKSACNDEGVALGFHVRPLQGQINPPRIASKCPPDSSSS